MPPPGYFPLWNANPNTIATVQPAVNYTYAGPGYVPPGMPTVQPVINYIPKVSGRLFSSRVGRTALRLAANWAYRKSGFAPRVYRKGGKANWRTFGPIKGRVRVVGRMRRRRGSVYRRRLYPSFLWDKYHRKGAFNYQSPYYGSGRRTSGRGARHFNLKGRARRFNRKSS